MASYAATFAATAAFGLAACAAFLDDKQAGIASAETSEPFETVPEDEAEPVAGGYAPADMEAEGAETALRIATDAIHERYPTRAQVETVSLETQLVAGLNYRYRIEMSGSPQARAIYEAVIYRDLEDNYELTSLTKLQ